MQWKKMTINLNYGFLTGGPHRDGVNNMLK